MLPNSTADKTSPPSRIPYRSNLLALGEGVILLGGLAILDYNGVIDMSASPVHPFLFVIMLMSAQYGVYGGIFSAIGAVLFDHIDGWPIRPVGQAYADFFLTAWALPLSWLVAGLLVGIVTSRHRKALAEQATMLEAAQTAEKLISSQYQVLAERNRKLERGLAGLSEPVAIPAIDLRVISPAKAAPLPRKSNGVARPAKA